MPLLHDLEATTAMTTGGKHTSGEWQALRKRVMPLLRARLPHPCPRCGNVMVQGMPLDLGHISRNVALTFEPSNVRLEHRSCNRRDGQRITTGIRMARKPGAQQKDRPQW